MKIREVADKKTWEKFVLSQHPNVFLQSWNWGRFHQMLGKRIIRMGLFEKEKLLGIALLIKEEAKRGRHLIIPGGPILADWNNKRVAKVLFGELKRQGKKEKAIFIRVRPNIHNTPLNRQLFRKLGFQDAPMHLHAETTLHLDLTQTEEETIRKMRKTTRYLIRRAQRDGVETQISKNINDIGLLHTLQREAVERHKFIPFSKEFFEKHFRAFIDDGQIALIKADYHGETLAIGMFIFYGDTGFYHYSGSSSRYPKIPASYAMLWRAIQEAKKRGCKIFDLWGIAPTGDPRHRFAGVTRFKKGFGGTRIDYLHAQDLPLSPGYLLAFVFETLRRKIRHL